MTARLDSHNCSYIKHYISVTSACPRLRGRQRGPSTSTIRLDHSQPTPGVLQQPSRRSNSFRHLPTPRGDHPSNINFHDALRPNRLRYLRKIWHRDAQAPPLPPPTVRVLLDLRYRAFFHRVADGLRSSGGKRQIVIYNRYTQLQCEWSAKPLDRFG